MTITCPSCGFSRPVAESRLGGRTVIAVCPNCACRFRFSASGGAGAILPPKTPGDGESAPQEEEIRQTAAQAYQREAERFAHEEGADAFNPWDCAPAPRGWLAAFLRTAKLIMFSAPAFFASLDPRAKLLRALCFFLIVCVVQTLAETAWSGIFRDMIVSSDADDPQLRKLSEMLAPAGNALTPLLLRAVLMTVQLYVFSFLMFLVYRLLVRERATYSLVFQIMAYSFAPALLGLAPVLGSLAGAVWCVACLLIGCRAAMRLSWPQTILGFLPLLFVTAPMIMQAAAVMRGI